MAERYDDCRPRYPTGLVALLVATASLGPGRAVLEVGCGTGQLTEPLARHRLEVTAIDISPEMLASARRRVPDAGVTFLVSSFEAFEPPGASFDLVAFADSFHWIDPEHRFARSARLLRPRGWLAVTSIHQLYDEPLGAALRAMWEARSDVGVTWADDPQPGVVDALRSSPFFGEPRSETDVRRVETTVAEVVSLEGTRATALSWPEEERAGFADELAARLAGEHTVSCTQVASLTMASVVA